MSTLKNLELKHLAAYLPYGIMFHSSMDKPFNEYGISPIWTLDGINKMFGEYCLLTKENNDAYAINTCKLILRQLSALTKEIDCPEVMGEKIVPVYELKKQFCNCDNFFHWLDYYQNIKIEHSKIEWCVFQKLLEWHFDVFGLIDAGLAIDINTIK